MSRIQYQKGDKVVPVEPPLKRQDSAHLITAPNGKTVSVNWHDRKASLVGKLCEVAAIKENGLLCIMSGGTEWLFHPDWVHFPGPDKCTCEWVMVLRQGCTCGRMNREKAERDRLAEQEG